MKSIPIAFVAVAIAMLIIAAACTTEKTVYVLPDGTEVTPTAAQATQAADEGSQSGATQSAGSNNELSLEEIVETTSSSVVQIEAGTGSGSGFIISEDGLVVTNAHVVGNKRMVKVWLSNGRNYDAEVIGLDVDADLAVLRIDGEKQFDALPLGNPENTRLGMEVIALGFPLADIGDNLTVTRGILSSSRTLDGVEFLQTDAAINPGNSGGPLINRQGEVIGVNTFKVSGFDVDNIGFAVSIAEFVHRKDKMKKPRFFVSISSGLFHTCQLDEVGTVVCWGNDKRGQSSPPEGEHFRLISSGGLETCGLRKDNSVICWGRDDDGQATPPEGEKFELISGGGNHYCGLRADGTAVCWGSNGHGQTTPPRNEHFILLSISSGGFHSCGLRVSGSAVCWGDDEYGQASPPEGEHFRSISSGGFHSCGLREDNSVICWGRDDDGQATPPKGEKFELISGGAGFTCGLRGDGSAVCWGDNEFDQTSRVPIAEHFVSISSGGSHVCGLHEDGNTVCWGDNEFGQASPPLP